MTHALVRPVRDAGRTRHGTFSAGLPSLLPIDHSSRKMKTSPVYVDATFSGTVSDTGRLKADGKARLGATTSRATTVPISLTGTIAANALDGTFGVCDTSWSATAKGQ
jgi:hypothetical protein